mgnify:CR=1 FL=1
MLIEDFLERVKKLNIDDHVSIIKKEIPIAICVMRTSSVRFKVFVIDDESACSYSFTSKDATYNKVLELLKQ